MDAPFLDKLPFVDFGNHTSLPSIPAVYFCVSRWGQILYIGQSIRLRRRWNGHPKMSQLDYLGCSKIAWMKFKGKPISKISRLNGRLECVEQFYLRKYRPLLNKRIHKVFP